MADDVERGTRKIAACSYLVSHTAPEPVTMVIPTSTALWDHEYTANTRVCNHGSISSISNNEGHDTRTEGPPDVKQLVQSESGSCNHLELKPQRVTFNSQSDELHHIMAAPGFPPQTSNDITLGYLAQTSQDTEVIDPLTPKNGNITMSPHVGNEDMQQPTVSETVPGQSTTTGSAENMTVLTNFGNTKRNPTQSVNDYPCECLQSPRAMESAASISTISCRKSHTDRDSEAMDVTNKSTSLEEVNLESQALTSGLCTPDPGFEDSEITDDIVIVVGCDVEKFDVKSGDGCRSVKILTDGIDNRQFKERGDSKTQHTTDRDLVRIYESPPKPTSKNPENEHGERCEQNVDGLFKYPETASKNAVDRTLKKSVATELGSPKKPKKYAYGPVTCKVCGKELSHTGSLSTHMRIHTKEKPFTCGTCNRSFSIKFNYKSHMLTHEPKQFKCDMCKWSFTTVRQLDKHKSRHDRDKNFGKQRPSTVKKGSQICEVCGQTSRSYSELQIHLRAHSGEKAHTCDICGRGFNVKCNFKRHLLRHGSTKPHKCDFCEKSFYEKRHMTHHMKKMHEAKPLKADESAVLSGDQVAVLPSGSDVVHTCDYCADVFASAEACTKHQQTKHFKCPACQRVFSARADLKTHMAVHSNERPFVCSLCSKTFKTKKCLLSHKQAHSEHGKFMCSHCGVCFRQHQGLWRHLQYHSDIKKHICDICQKKFAVKNDLMRHRKIHLDKKFRCHYCSEQFDARDQAMSHVAGCLPQQDMNWLCVECCRLFRSKSMLLEHQASGCQQKSLEHQASGCQHKSLTLINPSTSDNSTTSVKIEAAGDATVATPSVYDQNTVQIAKETLTQIENFCKDGNFDQVVYVHEVAMETLQSETAPEYDQTVSTVDLQSVLVKQEFEDNQSMAQKTGFQPSQSQTTS